MAKRKVDEDVAEEIIDDSEEFLLGDIKEGIITSPEPATYLARLLDALERSQYTDFEYSIKNGIFMVVDQMNYRAPAICIGVSSNELDEKALQELLWEIEEREEEQSRERQQQIQRRPAIVKLNVSINNSLLGLSEAEREAIKGFTFSV